MTSRNQTYKYVKYIKLVTDGGCRGNPGPGAIAVIILDGDSNEVLERHSACIGHTTNNQAEYHALIRGLDMSAKYTRKKVVCMLDSQLVANQMNGLWRLRNDQLRALYHEVKRNESPFEEVVYQHCKRTHQFIRKADWMVNEAFEGRTL